MLNYKIKVLCNIFLWRVKEEVIMLRHTRFCLSGTQGSNDLLNYKITVLCNIFLCRVKNQVDYGIKDFVCLAADLLFKVNIVTSGSIQRLTLTRLCAKRIQKLLCSIHNIRSSFKTFLSLYIIFSNSIVYPGM